MKSYITKIDNQTIDASQLFLDIQAEYEKTGEKKYKRTLDYFDGKRLSASFLGSFLANPANCVYDMARPFSGNYWTELGSAFHECAQDYVEGRELKIPDEYKKDLEPMLECSLPKLKFKNALCEYMVKTDKLVAKDLDKEWPLDFIAFIDVLEDGKKIIDYKTNKPRPGLEKDYQNQMIIYKWAAEQHGYPIESAELFLARTGQVLPVDVSITAQAKTAKDIDKLLKSLPKDRIFKFTDKGYVDNEFKQIMNDYTKWLYKIPVEI